MSHNFTLDLRTDLAQGINTHLPAKKLSLLLWKSVMLVYGDLAQHDELKAKAREEAGLRPAPKGTQTLTFDIPKRKAHTGKGADKLKQTGMLGLVVTPESDEGAESDSDATLLGDEEDYQDDGEDHHREGATGAVDDAANDGDHTTADADAEVDAEVDAGADVGAEVEAEVDAALSPQLPPTPPNPHKGSLGPRRTPVLPLTPKVSQACIDKFKEDIDCRFHGYYNKETDTIGPPPAVQQAIEVLEKNLYVSLAEHQVSKEAEIEKLAEFQTDSRPGQQQHTVVTRIDALYAEIVWSLGRYAIAMLKILGYCQLVLKDGAGPSFSSELTSEQASAGRKETLLEKAQRNQDSERLKEVVAKAVTSVLLLLYKHFRLQHVYQASDLRIGRACLCAVWC